LIVLGRGRCGSQFDCVSKNRNTRHFGSIPDLELIVYPAV